MKVPAFHHVAQRWHAAAVKLDKMRFVGSCHAYRGTVGETLILTNYVLFGRLIVPINKSTVSHM